MLRRDFLRKTATGMGAAWLSSTTSLASVLAFETPARKFNAHDEVTLGKTGIRTSRLAMGTGTIGFGGASNQTRLGMSPFARLLVNGYHENGLTLLRHRRLLRQPSLRRQRTQATSARQSRRHDQDRQPRPSRRPRDLDRFRRELGVDYIDIVLIHCVTEADWTTRYRGVMDILSEAKHQGIIRAHGVSCHSHRCSSRRCRFTLGRSRSRPPQPHRLPHGRRSRHRHHDHQADARDGKGIIGMKILGQGDMRNRPSEAIRYALNSGVLDAFTIGAESQTEQNDLTQRIAAA